MRHSVVHRRVVVHVLLSLGQVSAVHDGVRPAAVLECVQFVAHPMALHRDGMDSEGAVFVLGDVLVREMEYGAVLMLHLVHAQTRTCTHFALQDRIHHATRTFWRRRPKHHLGLGIRAHLQAVTWARRHVFPCGVVVHQHRTVEDHATFQAQEQSVLGMGCVDSANPLPGVVRRPIFVACADSAFCHGLQKRDAHHAVGHGQVACFRNDLAIQQHDAVRVQSRNGVGRHVFGPAFMRWCRAHGRHQHRRQGAVLPALRLSGRHRQVGHGLTSCFGQRSQTRGRCKPRHKRVRFFVGCGHQAISSLTQSYPFASNSRASSLGPDLTIWPSLNTCTWSGTMWSRRRW